MVHTRRPIILLKPVRRPSRAVRILTSPKTTLALAGTLGTLLFPAAALVGVRAVGRALVPKTIGGVAKLAFVGGALTAVPTLATTFNPFRAGQKAAPFIADPSLLLPKDKPLREKVKEVAKAGGIGAGVVAAVVGGAAVVKKAIEKAKKPVPVADLPTPILPDIADIGQVVSQERTLGAVQPTPTEPTIKEITQKPLTIRNTFNPTIDIRFSKSRKFINQQILVRQ